MKLLLVALLIFPLTASAGCEIEKTYFNNAVNLFDNIKKLHDINKKLFVVDKLSKKELDASLLRLEKGARLVIKSEKLYKECQHRYMI